MMFGDYGEGLNHEGHERNTKGAKDFRGVSRIS